MKKQGMRLRWPENPHKKNKAWLLQTVVSMLACTVLLLTGSELIGFGGSATMIVMAAIGIYLCLMYGLLLRSGKSLWFFYGTLMVLLLLVLLFRERVLEGYRLFWNQMSDAKVLGTGWVLPEWELQLPSEKSGICLTVFNILLSGVLTLLVCFLTSFAPPVLAALLPGAALVGMSVFGAELSFGWLLAILATSVLILLSGGWGSRNALASVTMSWVVSGAVAVALILLVSLSGISNWSTQVGEQIQEAIHKHKFETEHTTLPEGDFRKYEEVEKGAEVALIVTMETPEDMYLRGFTGEVFEENQWKPLEKDLLVKNKNLLYWLNLNAFNPNAQFQAAAGELGLPTNTVTVQNMGACSLYRYVPFSLCGGEALEPENLNTEGVLSEGERVYTYSAVSGGSEAITQVLQHLQQSNEKMLLQYRKAESGYRHFVYNFYLQVPEDAKQLLAESWNDTAAAYGSIERLNYQQAQECALRFLSEIFPENGTPEETELPLDIAKGSSYQYATVAVLTLRRIAALDGDFRLRFMTSHPKDASDRLIEAMATEEKIVKHFHLPVQSGSNEILKQMNRKYTAEAYLEKIAKLRAAVPDVSITSDIIVGFPGETEEDFEGTLRMLEAARYDMIFSFIYSPRNGTPAAKMENQVPHDVSTARFERLLATQNKISDERNARFLGRKIRVLAEDVSKNDETMLTGRGDPVRPVHFAGSRNLIGQFVDVEITGVSTFCLEAKLI